MKRPKLTLPQPKVFKEIDVLRVKMQRKARRRGWDQYVAEVNIRAGHLLGKPPVPSPAKHIREPILRLFGTPPLRRAAPATASARPG